MREPAPGAFRGVAMSTEHTLALQRERFEGLGLSTYEHVTLRDVDTIADARAVAAEAPRSRFAAALRELG
jgi:hypothetical protein